MVFITSATWHEITKKVDIQSMQAYFKDLKVGNYSNEVSGINFMYIAMRPENRNHPESIAFDAAYGELNVSLKLDYEKLESADKEVAMEMMKALFLEAIDRFEELEIAFEVERFKEDVRGLFYPEVLEPLSS